MRIFTFLNFIKLILTLLTITILIGVFYFVISSFIAYQLTIPQKNPVTFDPKKIGERYADVVFRASDNAQLAGWYFPGVNNKAIMFVHGAGGQNRANEVYGTPEIAKYFHELGYTILLFDLRGNGESEKTRLSFGQYEANDIAGAYNYLIKQEYEPESIGIISDSLGAIATIMAADSIKGSGGIVLDSPATEVRTIVSNIMADEKHVPRFLHPGTFLAAKIFFRIDINSVVPIDKISLLSQTPLLFLHGGADTLIVPAQSAQLLAKVERATRFVFPNTEHVETYISNKQLYLEKVSNFFSEALK